ncbi:STAS domain-containing protein [Rhizobacter sp. AJA081-3]|uniref:STAS domain-containing protein n=1 Tax=Rhizobacter sp. AJA081-3 TaxID=2753607 RepID=UPI001AE0256D|nr:STAS domain-containing protein [Rhizobacter sp. AJA081-3]QTN23620.1 STAS domain-containing protein [Rhizobacter sp. AJA081-3]
MPSALALPAELTIYTVGETRPQWLAWLTADDAETLRADASGVTEVDAAGVQLLVALARALQAQQRSLLIERPSPALRGACERLGLTGLLEAERTAGAGA